jgi:hypothetical protein
MSGTTDTIPTTNMIDHYIGGAHVAIICELIGTLIRNGVLNQGDVVARLELLSLDLMKRPGAAYAVPVVDIVRDYAAGDRERVPS